MQMNILDVVNILTNQVPGTVSQEDVEEAVKVGINMLTEIASIADPSNKSHSNWSTLEAADAFRKILDVVKI